ncbi:MAG: GspE/PulE family protein, partial [Candidatus Paceibacterota bacterium]
EENVQNPESKFIKRLIDYALAKEASDIHIIPKVTGTFLKIRIDGELFEHPEYICTLDQHQIIINRLKILAKLNISEQRLPQDGAISLNSEQAYQKLRLSIMPTIYGEKAVIRLPKNDQVPSLKDLGLDNFTLQNLHACLAQQVGLIILCGPTGSGKTTTIYSALKELSNKNLCLASIEDPVEIFLPNVDQTSIKPEITFNYQHALKNILRQDPDVLLIGEIRDRESADIALQAALSGHLIFSSVHAGSVQQAINRLIHLNLDASFLADALKLIINQRLIPCLCRKCKEELPADPRLNFSLYKAKGCAECNYIGYKERQVISETLLINQKIRQKIAENKFSVNTRGAKSKFYRSYQNQLKKLFSLGEIDLLTYRKYSTDEQFTLSS